MPYPVFHRDSFRIPFALLALSETARKLGAAPGLRLLLHIVCEQLVRPGHWLSCSAAGASKSFGFASPRTMKTALNQAEASGLVSVHRQFGRNGNEVLMNLANVCRNPADAIYLKAWTEVVLEHAGSLEKTGDGAAFCLLVVLASLLSVEPCKALRIHLADLRSQTGLSHDQLKVALRNLKKAGIIDFCRRDHDWTHIRLLIKLPEYPQGVLQEFGPVKTK